MSKFPGQDDAQPPPYTPTAAEGYRDPFVLHLHDIQSSLQSSPESSDAAILSTLIEPISSFLAAVPAIRPPPRVVEAFFVPDHALGREWTLSDQGDRTLGELSRVVRVQAPAGAAGDEKKTGGAQPRPTTGENRGFDDWGRWDDDADDRKSGGPEALWWSDEDMAHRLASKLQPDLAHTLGRGRQPLVSTTVRADEVTFRRENGMGLWESTAGWAVVVRVRIQQS